MSSTEVFARDTYLAMCRDMNKAAHTVVKWDERHARLNISEEEVEAFRVGMVGSLRARVEAFNRACNIESELGIPLEAGDIDTVASPSGVSLNMGVLDFPHDEESYGL